MLHHYGNNHGSTFFSFLFSTSSKHSNNANNTKSFDQEYASNTPFSSSVDCTLSLGTPSTRHAETTRSKPSSLSWDMNVSTESNSNYNNGNNELSKNGSKEANGSTRPTRRCTNCDTTSTPLWRNGPKGPKSLCNACGIRYKKEERRAAAAATVITPTMDCRSGYEYGYGYQNSHQWGCYGSSVGKSASLSPYGEETPDNRDLSYMSWRLNMVQPQSFPVMDRTGLFPYN
ncbi:hypothetical protein LUZ60_008231 [Juncus effusus]|nr:hypothetical protein LUZ60_008231 [Juncus effusus]